MAIDDEHGNAIKFTPKDELPNDGTICLTHRYHKKNRVDMKLD